MSRRGNNQRIDIEPEREVKVGEKSKEEEREEKKQG